MNAAGNNAGKKILVVDDHADLAENLAEILTCAGFSAVVAASAEEALAHLAAEHVIAVLTDFRLPGLSGAELIGEIRRRGVRVPSVVMSAYTDDDTIARSRKAGALDVLPKPVEIARLMTILQMMLGDRVYS